MPEPRHLENAPISEAIIDLRVKLDTSEALGAIAQAANEVSGEYPQREAQAVREFLFAIAPGSENLTSRRRAPLGYRLWTADRRRVVQFRLDGFTYSQLRPYETWESLRNTAHSLWSVYSRHVGALKIVRVAVRYINHIPLPLPVTNLEDFFAAPPAVPPEWSLTLTGFLHRMTLREEQSRYEAYVTQTIGPGNDGATLVYLLDIDAFSGDAQEDSPAVWRTLEDLRHLKNRIFFNAVTDRLLERFE